jgi:hypothetical protein
MNEQRNVACTMRPVCRDLLFEFSACAGNGRVALTHRNAQPTSKRLQCFREVCSKRSITQPKAFETRYLQHVSMPIVVFVVDLRLHLCLTTKRDL